MIALLRVFLFIIFLIIFSLTGCFIGLLRPFNPYNTAILVKLFRPLVFSLLGLDVEIKGGKELQNYQGIPHVYVGNHQNMLDIFLFGFHVPKGTVAIGKQSLLYIPIFGFLFVLCGHILVQRKRHDKAMDTMKNVLKKMKEKKISVCILPEGTRRRHKGMGEFKKGAFYLAIQGQFPIVPMVASSLYGDHINYNRLRAGKVTIHILPKVETTGLDEGHVATLLEQVRNKMVLAFEQKESV